MKLIILMTIILNIILFSYNIYFFVKFVKYKKNKGVVEKKSNLKSFINNWINDIDIVNWFFVINNKIKIPLDSEDVVNVVKKLFENKNKLLLNKFYNFNPEMIHNNCIKLIGSWWENKDYFLTQYMVNVFFNINKNLQNDFIYKFWNFVKNELVSDEFDIFKRNATLSLKFSENQIKVINYLANYFNWLKID